MAKAIKFRLAYRVAKPGDVITVGDEEANELIAKGYAVAYDASADEQGASADDQDDTGDDHVVQPDDAVLTLDQEADE